jgi:hypothetical protein
MILISSCFILLINAVTSRQDKYLSYNRITSLILLYSIFLAFNSLDIICLGTGIGVYGGLFLITSIRQNFVVFILILSFFILQLISFHNRDLKYLKKPLIKQISYNIEKTERNTIIDLSGIIDFPTIILFILVGAVCLMSCCDLITMFLCLELQSYGLYILSSIYRNSELAIGAALTYFLLGGLSKKFFLICQQLSNYEKTLKLKVPNYIRKIISEWSNYLCKVITLKMKKTKIGYCVSKIINKFIIKEQWVDDSFTLKSRSRDLKCILRKFERNRLIKILSNQINLRGTRLFTSKAQLANPCFEKHNFDIPLKKLPTRALFFSSFNYKNSFNKNFSSISSYPSIVPEKYYENPDKEKWEIFSDNEGLTGIYLWKNKETGKTYVGSASNLSSRLRRYYSSNYINGVLKKSRSIIFSAILKDGIENFSLTIIEYCLPEKLIEREQYYINVLQPEYNILSSAGSSLGFKHSEETRKKKCQLIVQEKIIRCMVKFIQKKRVRGCLLLILKKYKKIEVYDEKNKETTIYNSMSDAAKALNIKHTIISLFISRNQQKPYKGRYRLKKNINLRH